jgi:hypothetical protein
VTCCACHEPQPPLTKQFFILNVVNDSNSWGVAAEEAAKKYSKNVAEKASRRSNKGKGLAQAA